MKQPMIPLPEPVWMITLTRGTAASRRAMIPALRFLLWYVPAGVVDWVLATTDEGRHSLRLTIAAACLAFVIAVLTVNVCDGEQEPAPVGPGASGHAGRWIAAAAAAVLAVAALAFWILLRPHQTAPPPNPVPSVFCPAGQHVTGVTAGWPECAR